MVNAFDQKKQKILSALNVSNDDYTDLSPKGSVDAGIRDLIDEINAVPGLVTTSSCAGRVSVFLEGKKRSAALLSQQAPQAAESEKSKESGPTGKGGGRWLFVSHDPVALSISKDEESISLLERLGLKQRTGEDVPEGASLVHFKFEPMILHIFTASLQEANKVLSAANAAGFRESGALNLTAAQGATVTPMVAVRSAGLSFDSIVAFESSDGRVISLVDEGYLKLLLGLSDERFRTNTERIERFRSHLKQQWAKEGKGAREKKVAISS
ncbi:hypothetical protein BT63DRAFT_425091 [Microthyrium microscopicum]|uniref:tRNA(Phe) 7-[(3-amino-3-carboxypropyl)-4-demethylwyosine(37)-N(4)]-methyltransferase n=1 Tax=Microthyrium microscopicum TaxID=703497 RepID=A0A6A6UDA6_9PEZI|nr:hypothetical protein BT63DRAFT_425091 [Microthyrium microscopicum]